MTMKSEFSLSHVSGKLATWKTVEKTFWLTLRSAWLLIRPTEAAICTKRMNRRKMLYSKWLSSTKEGWPSLLSLMEAPRWWSSTSPKEPSSMLTISCPNAHRWRIRSVLPRSLTTTCQWDSLKIFPGPTQVWGQRSKWHLKNLTSIRCHSSPQLTTKKLNSTSDKSTRNSAEALMSSRMNSFRECRICAWCWRML